MVILRDVRDDQDVELDVADSIFVTVYAPTDEVHVGGWVGASSARHYRPGEGWPMLVEHVEVVL